MSGLRQRGRRGVGAAIGVTAFAAAMVVLVAGCGGGSNSKNTAATGVSTSASGSTAADASGGSGSRQGGQADFQAYTACLSQHGVKVPTFSARPDASGSRRPRPTGSFVRPTGSFSRPPGGFAGGGGFGGGGFLGSASADPSTQAAMQACASLLPKGGFGQGGRGNGNGGAISATTFAAFKSCMSDNGVTITATDAQAGLRALDRNDAKTAAALKICQPILGTAGSGSGGVGSGAPSPSPSPST